MAKKKDKPNIILILADDMGYGDLGLFNKELDLTPNLDKLAREGLCFTQNYSASTVCAPARAGLLTGRYPHRTGVVGPEPICGLTRLSLNETTMADIFKKNGYFTGLIGKWHLGGRWDLKYHPNNRGFDEFQGFIGGTDYYDWELDCNQKLEKSEGRYLTDVLTEKSINFLEEHQNEPFFLHLAHYTPHRPLQAPEEEVKPFLEMGNYSKGESTVYGMIKRMDKGIGKVLNKLEDLGLKEDTLVIFSSDNGPDVVSDGDLSPVRSNYGLKGNKYLVYEGGIRVPLIVRWPAGIENKDFLIQNRTHFTDILPTLLAAADIEKPDNIELDGTNLLPLLQGENFDSPTRYWQWNRFDPQVICNASVREGKWKLVRPALEGFRSINDSPVIKDDKFYKLLKEFQNGNREEVIPSPRLIFPDPPEPELYNIEADPLETCNLAGEYPEVVSSLMKKLEDWFQEVNKERKEKL